MDRYGRQTNQDMRTAGSAVPRPAVTQMPSVPGRVGVWLRRRWWLAGLIVLAVALVGWLAYGYFSTKAQLDKLNRTTGANETQQLVNSIDNYMELPSETPTLATVSDAAKLRSQEFFRNAQDGDKVLIFQKDGRALLYRPSTKKVIEYTKVSMTSGAAGGTSSQ